MLNTTFTQQLIAAQNALNNFALKLTTNHEAAQDLVQDTALIALSYSDRYYDQNFIGWLFTIMKNLFYKQNKKDQLFLTNTDWNIFGSDKTTDTAASESDIYSAVNSLSDCNRETMRLYLSGYKYREIAEKLNTPIGTIKSRISESRVILQKRLKEYV